MVARGEVKTGRQGRGPRRGSYCGVHPERSGEPTGLRRRRTGVGAGRAVSGRRRSSGVPLGGRGNRPASVYD